MNLQRTLKARKLRSKHADRGENESASVKDKIDETERYLRTDRTSAKSMLELFRLRQAEITMKTFYDNSKPRALSLEAEAGSSRARRWRITST